MNNLQEKIKKTELYLPYKNSTKIETDWGFMFFNPENPMLIDGNRAVVTKNVCFDEIRNSINDFYKQKNLVPHAVTYNKFFECESIEKINRNCMLAINEPSELLLSRRRADITEDTTFDDKILESILGKSTKSLPIQIKQLLNTDGFHLLVSRLLDQPVAMCFLQETPFGISKISNVITGVGFRNCKFASELIRFAVDYAHSLSNDPVYLYTINETAKHIYLKAGFEVIDSGIDVEYSLI